VERDDQSGDRERTKVFITESIFDQDVGYHFSENPPLGRVLEEIIRRVLSSNSEKRSRLSLMIGDLNGNEHRALEWGRALARLDRDCGIGEVPMALPALSF